MRLWMPTAIKRPVSYAATLPARELYKAIEMHTNGSAGDPFNWFNSPANTQHLCSHFQVAADGRKYQYLPLNVQAFAEFKANLFAVSIETADGGHPERRWTVPQIASIVEIIEFVGAPGVLLADKPSNGIGWHSQYPDDNQNGHDCPGAVRVAQIHSTLIPQVRADAFNWRSTKRLLVADGVALQLPGHANKPPFGVDVTNPKKGAAFVALITQLRNI